MAVLPGCSFSRRPSRYTSIPQLLQPQVGAGEVAAAVPRVRCFDQFLQYVESRRLDAVAEQELLRRRKRSAVCISHVRSW
jgi:hypothetical protein